MADFLETATDGMTAADAPTSEQTNVVAEGAALSDVLLAEITNLIADAMAMGDATLTAHTSVVAEGVSFGDAAANELIHRILESLALTGAALPTLDAHATASDEARFADALVMVWQALAAEQVELLGTAIGHRTLLGALADSLHASGAVSSRLDAMAAVSAAIAVNGLLSGGWKVDAIDTVEFQDALATQLNALGKLVDSAGFSDNASPSVRITAIAADSLALIDDPGTMLEAFEALREDVVLYVTLRLGAAEYAGWVLSQGVAWEYRNYPFNGFAQVAGRYFGTADTGLFELVGADDNGEPIEGRIKTALMDFGTGKKKRVPDVYIAFAGGNKVVLKTITTDPKTGEIRTDIYTADVPPGDGLHNGRIKPGRSLKSRYWQFELTNVDGDALELDELAFRPLVLDRRL